MNIKFYVKPKSKQGVSERFSYNSNTKKNALSVILPKGFTDVVVELSGSEAIINSIIVLLKTEYEIS